MFGASLTEVLLGVRSKGNALWKRIGGALRVIIGMVTGPFLIFDVPAIVSRRTFKEFMTFTQTYLSSKFLASLGIILVIPLMLAMAIFSPLIQGLELPQAIPVSDSLEKRTKVESDAPALEVVKENSKLLHAELSYDPSRLTLIPNFKFSGQRNKLQVRSTLGFYHRDLQRTVQLEVLKTFNFKELLGIGLKGNFFLHEHFNELHNFVYSPDAVNPAFRTPTDEASKLKFATEVVSFVKLALELDENNAIEVMQTQTPLIKGLVDFRSSFLSLIEYKDFDTVGFVKIGNAYFIKISYSRQRPFDLVIPLIKGEGRIFKVDFDTREQLGALSSKFYKFSLEGADWYAQPSRATADVLSPLEVMDFFTSSEFKIDKLDPVASQALYGFYFEKSSEVLKRGDEAEYSLWKSSVAGVFSIMERVKESIPEGLEPQPGAEPVQPLEDPRAKLFQNFQDLKDAVDQRNKNYFGIEEGVSV